MSDVDGTFVVSPYGVTAHWFASVFVVYFFLHFNVREQYDHRCLVTQFHRTTLFLLNFFFSFSLSRLSRPLHVPSDNQIFEGEGVSEVEAHFQWSPIHAASLV